MKRLHVHVSVENLAENIDFYSRLFAAEPTVTRPDYAKWMLDDPRVNFAISARGARVGLDHLGMQVESDVELAEVHQRLEPMRTAVKAERGTVCCYAKSDKYWVTDPQGIAWETFHSLESIPVFGKSEQQSSACCTPVAQAEASSGCCASEPPTARSACC